MSERVSEHSAAPIYDDGEGPGFSPGAVLRGARESRGLSIEDVAHALKLAPRQVEAIEADAFEQLRGLTFARGFVRNYARYLGLDAEPLVAAIVPDVDPRQMELAPVSNARGEMPAAKSPVGTLLPAGITLAALIAVALAGWYLGWFRVPEPAVATDKAAPLVAPVNAPAPIAEVAPAAAPAPTLAVPSAAPPPAADTVTPDKPAAAPAAQRLSFEFDADSWVEIRDARGKVLHSQLHKGGSTQDVELAGAAAPYALVIGNATKVRLRYKEQKVDLVPHTKVTVARLNLP